MTDIRQFFGNYKKTNEEIKRNLLTSHISIVYDSKLKNFKSAILEEISLSQEYDFHYVMEKQNQLFDLFVKYQHLLTFSIPTKITKKTHPNNYALQIAMISDLELCNDWDNLLEQIERFDFHFTNFQFTLVNLDEKYNCCCQHICKVKNLFLTTNKITGLSVIVGCDCIEKMVLCNPDYSKEQQKQFIKSINETKQLNQSYSNALKQIEEERIRKEKLLKIQLNLKKILIYQFCLKFINEIKSNQVSLRKVKEELGYGDKKRISYYGFFQVVKIDTKWKRYITTITSPKYDTHLITILKIEKFKNKFKI